MRNVSAALSDSPRPPVRTAISLVDRPAAGRATRPKEHGCAVGEEPHTKLPRICSGQVVQHYLTMLSSSVSPHLARMVPLSTYIYILLFIFLCACQLSSNKKCDPTSYFRPGPCWPQLTSPSSTLNRVALTKIPWTNSHVVARTIFRRSELPIRSLTVSLPSKWAISSLESRSPLPSTRILPQLLTPSCVPHFRRQASESSA